MREKRWVLIIGLLFITSLAAAQLPGENNVVISQADGPHKINLDGSWHLAVATGDLKPASSSPDAVDLKAKEIASHRYKSWADIKVPQFLNRISWWLPNVSVEYERQETERVSKLPEGTATAQSAWYSKNILLSKNGPSQEVYANFEGVALVSRVYINGVYVGGHLGMFGSFKCRLTPYLKAGQNNQLLVYVERGVKSKDGDKIVSVAVSVPVTQNMLLSLNKSMFDKIGPRYNVMGIWLPVTLEVSETGGRIADVFFNPRLDGHTIQFTMENPDPANAVSGKLSYTITNKRTGKVFTAQNVNPSLKLLPGQTITFSTDKKGLKPELWSPDIPNLYIMDVRWTSLKGKLIHEWKEQVGYRTIDTKGEQVYLNGKPYWSRGADMPPYGYKPNDEKTARGFLQLMHDGNTVITRSHGNPWNDMWFTAADEIGIGVSCEASTWVLLSKDLPSDGNIAAWKNELLEIVKQYRNHPSILFYVVSNEGLPSEDPKNAPRLAIYKDVITAMRKLDTSRLIFQTSGNPDYNHIADIEDVHSYWDWYMPSSYVNDYTKPLSGLSLQDGRPFLSQEVAVPYSMIDDGSVHPSYIPRYCAQSWVGDLGVFGKNYAYFQEHIRAVAKLKAEKLRYSRAALPSAGFLLFCNATWIQYCLTRPVAEWKPFPVYYGVKEGYQPVLGGLTTTQYVFYGGDQVNTELFVVNDDVRATNFKNLTAHISFKDAGGKIVTSREINIGQVDYYAVKKLPLSLKIPANTNSANTYTINIRLMDGTKQVGINNYPIRIIAKKSITNAVNKTKLIALSGVTPHLISYLKSSGLLLADLKSLKEKADVIIVGASDTKSTKEQLEGMLKPGGRMIVLGQGEKAQRFCKEVIATHRDSHGAIGDNSADNNSSVQMVRGEFVEMLHYDPARDLYKGLQPMDWKWWAAGSGKPAFVTTASHKIRVEKNNVIPIGRYLEPHSYWSGDLDETYRKQIGYPVFAVNYSWGQLVVCELVIEDAIDHDPRAGQTILNLLTAEIKK